MILFIFFILPVFFGFFLLIISLLRKTGPFSLPLGKGGFELEANHFIKGNVFKPLDDDLIFITPDKNDIIIHVDPFNQTLTGQFYYGGGSDL